MKRMRMSDMIEEFIKELMEDDDFIEIQRNDLAEHFNCVPSQINYVIATAKNTSLNYLRDTKKYFAYSFDDFLCCPDDDGHSRYVEASLIRQEDVEALAKVWPKLDPKIRYILEEKYVLDKSSAEIAQDLGIKPDSVRMALTRARRAALSLLKSNQ